MDYCKITTEHRPHMMLKNNRFTAVISNPSETEKAKLADLFGYLPMVYTPKPEYDPETEDAVDDWYPSEVEEEAVALQVWTIVPLPTPEPTLEDRVDNLESGMDELLGGDA